MRPNGNEHYLTRMLFTSFLLVALRTEEKYISVCVYVVVVAVMKYFQEDV